MYAEKKRARKAKAYDDDSGAEPRKGHDPKCARPRGLPQIRRRVVFLTFPSETFHKKGGGISVQSRSQARSCVQP